MLNPYDRNTERYCKWHFDTANQRWQTRLKTPEEMRPSFEPPQTRATPDGIQINMPKTKEWIPASKILTPPDK